jgi:hypothetical protein
MNRAPDIHCTNENVTADISARLESLHARITSYRHQNLTVPSSRNRQLRHFQDELSSILNERAAILNQSHEDMAHEFENSAVMDGNNAFIRGDQYGVEDMTGRVAALDMRLDQANAGKSVGILLIVTVANTAFQSWK